MDDRRVGLVLRALRRRRGWRQQDLADAAGVSQSTVSRLERGHVDDPPLRTLRRLFAATEARVEVDVRWRGGHIDRLLDERHAALGLRTTEVLSSFGWRVLPEVTYQHFGERGSIDLLGVREAARAILVTELKSEVHSYEAMQRRLDEKARLAPAIALERVGWRPRAVGVLLVVEDSWANRHRLASLAPLVRAGLPDDARAVRRWMREPLGPLRGLWFLRSSRARTTARGIAVPARVIRTRRASQAR